MDDNKRMNLKAAGASQSIKAADHLKLSEHDSLRIFELLENPPAANAKLRAAAMAMHCLNDGSILA